MVADTGIFIEHLRAKDKRSTTLYQIADNSEIYLLAVTLYELHMGATSPEKQRDIAVITEDFTILPFTDEVARRAASIYHKLRLSNQMVEFRDIFIAATCLVHNLPIVTLNKKHFQRIDGLKML